MQRQFLYGLIVAGTALAGTMTNAQAQPLNVKTGLWETTIRSEAHGQLPIPQEQLQKMSPPQRAAMEKIMARNSQPRSHVFKHCVTQEELDKAESNFLAGEPGMKCENKLSKHTHSSVVGTMHCTKGSMRQTADFSYEARDREHISGKLNMTVSNGTNTMSSKGTMSSRWISASCGKTQ